MRKIHEKILKHIVGKLVIQGPTHRKNIENFYKIMWDAARTEFYEDNDVTLATFLQECFNNSIPKVEEKPKLHIKLHDFVIWESQGVVQWAETRRVVHIEEKDGQFYAFCDGSMTGIPVEQLRVLNY